MDTKTLPMLDFEIERLRPNARSERELAAADPNRPNPWEGAGKKLATLERERDELRLYAAGVALVTLLDAYVAERQRIPQLETQLAEARKLYTEAERNPTVTLYKQTRALATRLGMGQGFNDRFERFTILGNAEQSARPDDNGRQRFVRSSRMLFAMQYLPNDSFGNVLPLATTNCKAPGNAARKWSASIPSFSASMSTAMQPARKGSRHDDAGA